MRIVVLGTGPFAVPVFQWLMDSKHEVLGLVTRPTQPAKGREKGPVNPMREAAEARGLAVHAPASINSEEGKELLERLAPELLMVCDYGQILAADVLGLAPLGGINLHARARSALRRGERGRDAAERPRPLRETRITLVRFWKS